jgi:hypothetical protein
VIKESFRKIDGDNKEEIKVLNLPNQYSIHDKNNRKRLSHSINLLLNFTLEHEQDEIIHSHNEGSSTWKFGISSLKSAYFHHYEYIREYLGYELDETNVTTSICQLILYLENEILNNHEYKINYFKSIKMVLRDNSNFTKEFVDELNEICDKLKSSGFKSSIKNSISRFGPVSSNRSSGFDSLKYRSSQSLDSSVIIDILSQLENSFNDKISRLSLTIDRLSTKVDLKFESLDSKMTYNSELIKEIQPKMSHSEITVNFDEISEF